VIVTTAAVTEQKGVPSWGLDRLDQRARNLDNTYRYSRTGTGVKVFILDTGIKVAHPDFGGRASCGFNAYADSEDCDDGNGHGTHVSGTIGGTTYGVAKGVQLITVKILSKRGTGGGAQVLAGIEYVVSQKQASPATPMVVNMSIGLLFKFREIDDAVRSLVSAGIVTIVAAGNSHKNACRKSPSSAGGGVIVVAATNTNDRRARYSNFGKCVNIFAPGTNITSANIKSDTEPLKQSGTSMAAPHVTGVAALYLEANPTWTPAQVWEAMKTDATPDLVRCPRRRSPNLLLNTVNMLV